MALGDYMGTGLDPEMVKYLKEQQLVGALQGILASSGPSKIKVSPGQVIGAGLAGGMQGSQQGLGNIMAMQKMKANQDELDAKKRTEEFWRNTFNNPKTVTVDQSPGQGRGMFLPEYQTVTIEVPRTTDESARLAFDAAIKDPEIFARIGSPLASIIKANSSDKEFNAPTDVDTFLMSTNAHGQDYTTPSGRIAAQRWLATPEGAKAFGEWDRGRKSRENTGVMRDTGYLDANGQPILIMTRPSVKNPGEYEPVYVHSGGVSNRLPESAYVKSGLNAKDEEALVGYQKSMNFIDDIKTTLSNVSTGFPKIGEAKNALGRYMSKEDAIKFNTARDQMKNEAQSLIKGIPSNFDVENFIKVLPNADYTYTENKERLRQIENMLREGIRTKVANLKSQRMPIPEDIKQMMIKYKVNEGDAIKDTYTGSVNENKKGANDLSVYWKPAPRL